MRFISVCSGIEAASVAWNPLGWEAAMFSEIEPFPCSVLAHHYPDVPNRGDMTKYEDWPDEPVDLLCGGTPCQSFSVAGLRNGLDDPRGNLMLTYGAIAAKYRPRWLVWENVPGVLSSDEGRDFGSFLGLLGQLGYGFAYRVLDAQYAGVPQRRRRVFVVGCLGNWRSAAAVLFERHSLQGNTAPRRQAGQEPARCLTRGSGGEQRYDGETEKFICGTLDQSVRTHSGQNDEGFDVSEDGTGRGTPLVPVANTLQRHHGNPQLDQTRVPVAFDCMASGMNGFGIGDVTTPSRVGTKGSGAGHQAVMSGMQVRRLTPMECERLQGFPDGYTAIKHRGKPAADGPRYKALGNSWAVPCARWIGDRINAVESISVPKLEAAYG